MQRELFMSVKSEISSSRVKTFLTCIASPIILFGCFENESYEENLTNPSSINDSAYEYEQNTDPLTYYMCYEIDQSYIYSNCQSDACYTIDRISNGEYKNWQTCYNDMEGVLDDWSKSGVVSVGPNSNDYITSNNSNVPNSNTSSGQQQTQDTYEEVDYLTATPNEHGCWIAHASCIDYSFKWSEYTEDRLVVTYKNLCSKRVYLRMCNKHLDGTEDCGADGLKPGSEKKWSTYNASGHYSFKVIGSTDWQSDWVCSGYVENWHD